MKSFVNECYQTPGSVAHSSKASNSEASVNGKERWFNQKAGKCGEKVDSCPGKTNSKDSAQPCQFFLRKRSGGNLSKTSRQEIGLCLPHSSLCRLADSPFRCYLCPCDLPTGLGYMEIES